MLSPSAYEASVDLLVFPADPSIRPILPIIFAIEEDYLHLQGGTLSK